MTKHNLLAIDLAKSVFQVCGMSKDQKITFNIKLKRAELAQFIAKQLPTEVAMEACYSSHYWARQFQAMGHTVKLLPAQHVEPFVRGNKSDYNDVIGIAEAARRPNILPVPVKSIEQQDLQCLHRIRNRYVARRTGLINQTRGLLSEYGLIAPPGHKAFCQLLIEVSQPADKRLSPLLKEEVMYARDEYYCLSDRLDEINTKLAVIAKDNPLCQILLSIPGIGVINATALYSAIGNGSQFTTAREFAVWLGVTPRQSSSGETFKSGGITKRGNRYLRKQLIHGARAALSRCKKKQDKLSLWSNQLVTRRGINKATVALAARMARLAWTLLNRHEKYQAMV